MKYRTVIELICDASDKEEASNIAGDYLKGDIDFGVEMRNKTECLWTHKAVKYTATSLVMLLVFSSLLFKITPIDTNDKVRGASQIGFKNTYTVMPALKTKHKADFKKEWQEKEDEAIIDYLKK